MRPPFCYLCWQLTVVLVTDGILRRGVAMRKSLLITPLAAVTFLVAASMPASAGTVTFDFNLLTQQTSAQGATVAIRDAAAAANALAIQTYMQNQMGLQGAPGTIAVSPGAIADKSYDGEGHVVGNGATQAVTLGTSDGSATTARTTGGGVSCNTGGCSGNTDTFLRNDSFATPSAFTSFSFTFSGWMTITSVTFDYEIFPDVSNAPDMIFSTNLGTVAGWPKFGVQPGTGGVSSPNTISALSASETTNQLIGTGTFATPGIGVNKLIFTDWPATVGIDNLTVNFTTNGAVPEPSSVLLLASGLAALYARRKTRKA
jgi:hypothetical protein